VSSLESQLHASSQENLILKKAVVVQNEKLLATAAQQHAMRAEGERLLAHARALERDNYALRSHLGSAGPVQGFGGGAGPPDVF
jgi:hypothetical protein